MAAENWTCDPNVKKTTLESQRMPTVPNNPILEFATSSRQEEPPNSNEKTTSLDNLTIFGTKPNAIVRPLQRETPAEDGLNDGFAKTIKRIEDDQNFLEKLSQKRNQFNKQYRELLPREPVKTVRAIWLFNSDRWLWK